MASTDTPATPAVDDVHDDVHGDVHDDLDDESWLATTQPKGFRVRTPLAGVGGVFPVPIGLWGGATIESNHNPNYSAPTRPTAGAGRTAAAGATTAGATTAGGAASGGAARGGLSGTVASVQGNQIQLTTGTGSTVTVTLLPSTTIARTASAAASDITAGETITVRGQTGADGNTTAQALTIVPATTAGG